jgi:hypothetical protein
MLDYWIIGLITVVVQYKGTVTVQSPYSHRTVTVQSPYSSSALGAKRERGDKGIVLEAAGRRSHGRPCRSDACEDAVNLFAFASFTSASSHLRMCAIESAGVARYPGRLMIIIVVACYARITVYKSGCPSP